jgi:ornithine--oxo-acid transaminase
VFRGWRAHEQTSEKRKFVNDAPPPPPLDERGGDGEIAVEMTTPFDAGRLFEESLPQKFAWAAQHINPAFVRVLQLLGLDQSYTRAEGCYLYDADGRRYLDCLGGYCVFNVGHNHPTVRRALSDALAGHWPNMLQMDASPLSGALARELVGRAPKGIEMVYFGNSGAEAVEAAMKFARCATGRTRLLAAHNAYHGLTYGALSLSGRPEIWQERFAPVVPDCALVPFGDAGALERELKRGDVAAFIVEPIQGEAGVVVPPDDYLARAQALCRRHGALFVLDEIQTGLGRTGKFLAAEHWGLEPDIVCLAKSLSGGFVPVSATLTRRDIMLKVFDRLDRCVIHCTTFGENNLAMVAGLATLRVLDEERLVENAARMGARLMERLRELQSRHEFIAEVRGRGLFVAVRFGEPRSLKLKAEWNLAHKAAQGLFVEAVVMALMREHRILIQAAGHDLDVLKITPPLVAGEAEIDYFVNALDAVLADCRRLSGPVWKTVSELAKRALKT